MDTFMVSYSKELERKVNASKDLMVLCSTQAEGITEAMEETLESFEHEFWEIVGEGDFIRIWDSDNEITYRFNKKDAEELLGDITILGRSYFGDLVSGDKIRISDREKGTVVCEFNAYTLYGAAISYIVDVIQGNAEWGGNGKLSTLSVTEIFSHGCVESESIGSCLKLTVRHRDGVANLIFEPETVDAVLKVCKGFLNHLDGMEDW